MPWLAALRPSHYVIIALVLALGVQTARIEGVPIIGGGLKAQVERLQKDLAFEIEAHNLCKGNVSTLEGEIEDQNRAIIELSTAGDEAKARADRARREANRANARADEDAARIRNRDRTNDVDCETPDEILGADI